MKQQQRDFIADRLQLTVNNMKALRSEKFHYGSFVLKFDQHTPCGTVCCVAGWYPAWFPESGVEWDPGCYHDLTVKEGTKDLHGNLINSGDPNSALESYHMITNALLQVLFYGDTIKGTSGHLYRAENGLLSTKTEVIKMLKDVVRGIREGDLDDHLLDVCPADLQKKTKKSEKHGATTT